MSAPHKGGVCLALDNLPSQCELGSLQEAPRTPAEEVGCVCHHTREIRPLPSCGLSSVPKTHTLKSQPLHVHVGPAWRWGHCRCVQGLFKRACADTHPERAMRTGWGDYKLRSKGPLTQQPMEGAGATPIPAA